MLTTSKSLREVEHDDWQAKREVVRLCELAATEQNPDKLIALVTQIETTFPRFGQIASKDAYWFED